VCNLLIFLMANLRAQLDMKLVTPNMGV